MKQISIVECPRDAMQGWLHLIPTATKIAYLNQLLDVGFDVLDFGSFVSPKAIPQMADTREVLASLKPSSTELLAIIANTRGAEEACRYERISYLGFPFSISETFQMRNTNKSIADSFDQVRKIQELAQKYGKRVVIYISMGFGNPYGDPYSTQLAIDYVGRITDLGIQVVAMSDTIGVADPENINYVFSQLIPAFPDTEIGAHFHSTPHTRIEKLAAAYHAGCMRFDSSINGIGGCPMAKDELVGNMATETLVHYFEEQGALPSLNRPALDQALAMAPSVFS